MKVWERGVAVEVCWSDLGFEVVDGVGVVRVDKRAVRRVGDESDNGNEVNSVFEVIRFSIKL